MFGFSTPTTEKAIEHFTRGVEELKLVTEYRNQEANEKSAESARLAAEANEARTDAAHAARIAERFEDLIA